MAWQVILYELGNGTDKLESLVVDDKPAQNTAAQCAILYGAKRWEIIEVTTEQQAYGTDCRNGACDT